MAVSTSYIKDIDFTLSSLSELSAQEPKFTRIGYTFSNWKDENGITYTNQQVVNFNADEVNLSAIWTVNQYTVSWDTPVNGSIEVKAKGIAISSGSNVDYQTVLTITAIADAGYKLKKLLVNGVEFESGSTFIVGDSNVTIAATFDNNTGTITYWPGY